MKIKTVRAFLVGLSLAATIWGQTPAPQNPPAAQTPPATPAPARRQARPGASGTIQGTVKDDTGGVIPGATVTLATQKRHRSDHPVRRGWHVYLPWRCTGSLHRFRNLSGSPAGRHDCRKRRGGSDRGWQYRHDGSDATAGSHSNGHSHQYGQHRSFEQCESAGAKGRGSGCTAGRSGTHLEADLEALAGPAAGPGGNQIFIDGFTGGRLPPKESIREIRINSNPFSAEFDKLGYGRIQIFTKPGSDKFHGQGSYDISDGIWNSRNPFLTTSPPFKTQMIDGNISGPLGKHASFFIDAQERRIDDNGIVTAIIPTANFLGTQSQQTFYPTPQRRYTTSPRVDWQLGANNTLSMRYTFLENDHLLKWHRRLRSAEFDLWFFDVRRQRLQELQHRAHRPDCGNGGSKRARGKRNAFSIRA